MEHEAYEKGWFTLLAMSQGPNPPNQPIQPLCSRLLYNLNWIYCSLMYCLYSAATTTEACNSAPHLPSATTTYNLQYAFVENTALPGEYFADFSTVKRFYCPCSMSWGSLLEDNLSRKW